MKVRVDQEVKTYTKVSQDPRRIEEIREEIWVLIDNDSWVLVSVTEYEKKPIGFCLVFKVKHNADDMIN